MSYYPPYPIIYNIPIQQIYSIPFSGVQGPTGPQGPQGSSGLELETESVAAKEVISEGCACKKCKNFNEFAEPNQPDKTFICYACRHGL